jgi:hypothetical protein
LAKPSGRRIGGPGNVLINAVGAAVDSLPYNPRSLTHTTRRMN